MSALLTEEQLKEWTGYRQRSKLEAFLRREKIPFHYGKGNKIIATQTAIDQAISTQKAANQSMDKFF
jgi:hypothetical protein